ncbi:GntR family transcriptional regulator [Actinokineospora sp. HUAS TT18]|uniref:GntR family transcriptional regulator n=1 Tax=Actinokineospora sp. HUAS TT18 TaxID=3447451 RepID=UPI003F52418B
MAAEDIERAGKLARRVGQGRSSAAEVAASALRDLIMEGVLPPGTRITEETFMAPLDVSRNTLREAFRLLSHERLLVHKLNRGVFVRSLTREDVVDLYNVRRLLECAAIKFADAEGSQVLRSAVERGEEAAKAGLWTDVGTANIRFHQAIVGLVGSQRLDEVMRQVGAELRLGFHEMGDPRALHEGYLKRNRDIVNKVDKNDLKGAEELLRSYLDDAEREMFDAFTQRDDKLAN